MRKILCLFLLLFAPAAQACYGGKDDIFTAVLAKSDGLIHLAVKQLPAGTVRIVYQKASTPAAAWNEDKWIKVADLNYSPPSENDKRPEVERWHWVDKDITPGKFYFYRAIPVDKDGHMIEFLTPVYFTVSKDGKSVS
jgi:hypothetical protein